MMLNIKEVTIKQQLCCLMLIAFLLRLALVIHHPFVVFNDAQYFLDTSGVLLGYLLEFDLHGFFNTRVRGHWGTAIMSLFPHLIAMPGLPLEKTYAVFFAAPAVLNIYLVYLIAKRLLLGEKTAIIAAMLYTFSFSAIYWTVQSFCYEMAVFFILLAFVVLLGKGNKDITRLLLTGFVFWWAFMVYYGYWVLILWGLMTATFYRAFATHSFTCSKAVLLAALRDGSLTACGFFLPFVFLVGVSALYGFDFLSVMVSFSGSITQGDFSEGYSLPFFFLFYTEKFWFVVSIIGAVWCFSDIKNPLKAYLLGGLLFNYAGLTLLSSVLEYTVVYGRLVKQMAIPLCFISALFLAQLQVRTIVICFLLIVAGYTHNYYQLYNILFGEDFFKQAEQLKEEELRRAEPGVEYIGKPVCKLNEGICEIPDNCTLVRSALTEGLVYFYHYDGMTPEVRTEWRRLGMRAFGYYRCELQEELE